jgi:hypothetical protein
MKTIKMLLLGTAICALQQLNAQNGILKGTITDETGQTMPSATVKVLEDTTMITGTTTDINGDYTIKQLIPGSYNIQISYVGYAPKLIKKVIIDPNATAYVNAKMTPGTMLVGVVVEEEYRKPIISKTYSTVTNITVDQIENMAVSKGDIVGIITAVTPGVIASEDGTSLYVRGSRNGSTAFYVDGNRVMGSPNVPGLSIASMEVLLGGVPAEYGDCTGGIVIITTKEYQWEEHRAQMKREAREASEE